MNIKELFSKLTTLEDTNLYDILCIKDHILELYDFNSTANFSIVTVESDNKEVTTHQIVAEGLEITFFRGDDDPVCERYAEYYRALCKDWGVDYLTSLKYAALQYSWYSQGYASYSAADKVVCAEVERCNRMYNGFGE